MRFIIYTVLFLSFILLGWGEESLAKPLRVVSMSLCSDELVLRLVDRENIAAVTKSALIPYISSVTEQAKGMKTIMGTVEEILMLDPDLIIAGEYTDRQKVSLLKQLGFNVKLMGNSKNFDELKNVIREVAQLTEEQSKAEVLIKDMEKRLQRLYIEKPSKINVVFYWPGGRVAGTETMIHSIMESAGVYNMAEQFGIQYYDVLNLENLVMNNPDLMIMSDYKTEIPTILREILSHPVITKGFPGRKTMHLPSQFLLCGSPANIDAAEILSAYVKENFKKDQRK
ncbi:hypothetical protein MNBD_UNCLBAC01-666 [hydrothermal vent metagenome]|uniref:Fe/B12 periplasmic-binding domain-containing protein n=1 Tax=hydrothermal vent metagenome TaxID=652676 RepID=A0A3B1CY30_9ZZZZ